MAGGSGPQWKRFMRTMEQGEYYDAEQALRSAYHREMAGAEKGKPGMSTSHALSMLVKGIGMLVDHKQLGSATVLLVLVIKHPPTATNDDHQTSDIPEDANDVYMHLVRAMYNTWQTQADAQADHDTQELAEMSKAMQKALDLALPEATNKQGSEDQARYRELCEKMAMVKWRLGRFGDAQAYFVQSASSDELAHMVWNWCGACSVRSERPLIVARCFLLILTNTAVFRNDKDRVVARARAFTRAILQLATTDNENDKFMARGEPLLHFIDFVGEAAMRESAELFKLARSVYQPSLARDPALEKLLDKIGIGVFHIQPVARAAPPNLFGDMMGNMMRGMFAGPPR